MKKLLLMAAAALLGLSASAEDITSFGDIQLTTDVANPHYYLIKNLRNPVGMHQRGATYAATPGAAGQIKLRTASEVVVSEEGKDDHYDVGSLWYFVQNGEPVVKDEKTFHKVNIYNAYTNQCINNPQAGTWGGSNLVWCLVENSYNGDANGGDADATYTGFNITTVAMDLTNNNTSWNNAGATNTVVGFWKGNDASSIWALEEPDATKAAATIPAIKNGKYNTIKVNGDVLANIEGFPADKKTAWQTATSNTPSDATEADIEAITTAYETLVNGVHIMFRSNKAPEEYLSHNNGVPGRNAETGARVFTLKSAGAEGFYVYNEFQHKYIVHPTQNTSAASYNVNISAATVYNIDVWDATNKKYGIYSTAPGLANDQKYWHTNQNAALWRWQADDNSSWYISFADEDQAATECYAGAIAAETAAKGNFDLGDKIGQYSFSGAAYIAAKTAVENINDESTNEEKRNAADALFASLESAAVINPIPAGRFYRFQNVNSGKFITNSNSGNNIPVAKDEDAEGKPNSHTDILYYDGQHLVSYTTGLVIGKFIGRDTANSWKFVDKDNTDDKAADDVQFLDTPGHIGKYSICPSPGRYLYGGGNTEVVNCNGGPDDTNCAWTVTEVEYLPVYFGDNLETTLYLPVGVDNAKISGRVEAHDLSYNPEKTSELVKAQTAAQSIEPNHGYFVRKIGTDTNTGWNSTTKCIYLELNYDAVAAPAESSNVLSGSIYATAPTDKHFVLDDHSDENVNPTFSVASASIPGFTAHVVAPTEHSHAQYTVFDYGKQTSGISEVVAGGENGVEVIYDLQGRRVANASKGIFIINGVKTLVK